MTIRTQLLGVSFLVLKRLARGEYPATSLRSRGDGSTGEWPTGGSENPRR